MRCAQPNPVASDHAPPVPRPLNIAAKLLATRRLRADRLNQDATIKGDRVALEELLHPRLAHADAAAKFELGQPQGTEVLWLQHAVIVAWLLFSGQQPGCLCAVSVAE